MLMVAMVMPCCCQDCHLVGRARVRFALRLEPLVRLPLGGVGAAGLTEAAASDDKVAAEYCYLVLWGCGVEILPTWVGGQS